MTLEQHEFKLHRSTYIQISFTKYVSQYYTIHDPWLVESTDAEPQIQRADCKVISEFLTEKRVYAPIPALLKCQLYMCVYIYT